MTTASTALAERPATRLDQFAAEVLPPVKREQLMRSLPRHVRPELFERNLLNAFMAQPDLLKCHPSEVFREVAQIAALGLYLDPALGEAYLIVGYSKREGRHKPQRRVGYRELQKLARQSGEVSQVYAHEVCEHDQIEANLGLEKRFDHRPVLFADRGPIIGFYAVVKYRDGSDDFEPMSLAEVNRIRDRSDAWRAWKSGATKKPPPWETDPTEMGKKTVIRRLLKRVPQSPELVAALQVERDDGTAEIEQLAPPRGRPRLAHALRQAAESPRREPVDEPEPEPEPELPEHDPETGEILEEPGAAPGELPAADPEMFPPDVAERERLFEAGRAAAEKSPRELQRFLNKLPVSQRELLGEAAIASLRERAGGQEAP